MLAGPTWPHTHTLDVRGDDIYVDAGSGACRIDTVTITGDLQFQRTFDGVHYYVVEEVSGGEAFAGALICDDERQGQMKALVFSPKTRDIGIHFVKLADKHLNSIRKLKLEQPRGLA